MFPALLWVIITFMVFQLTTLFYYVQCTSPFTINKPVIMSFWKLLNLKFHIFILQEHYQRHQTAVKNHQQTMEGKLQIEIYPLQEKIRNENEIELIIIHQVLHYSFLNLLLYSISALAYCSIKYVHKVKMLPLEYFKVFVFPLLFLNKYCTFFQNHKMVNKMNKR